MDYLEKIADLQSQQRKELEEFCSKFTDSQSQCEMLSLWIDTGSADWYIDKYKQAFREYSPSKVQADFINSLDDNSVLIGSDIGFIKDYIEKIV